MKKANHFFIDGTYFKPTLYLQTIIIMYIDIITGCKIPGIYALLSNKNLESYNSLLEYVSQIINQNKKNNEITITIDFEEALITSVNKYFPNFRKIGCYYHFKQALYRNAQKYKLTGKIDKSQTLKLINGYLGKLPEKYYK